MGGIAKDRAQRLETAVLNVTIDKELLDEFKRCCKQLGCPMNVMLETFMRQYVKERFYIDPYDIQKWKSIDYEVDILNTTFNKEIYSEFKSKCKGNGYFLKHVIMAFIETYINGNFILEFIEEEKTL